MAHDETSCAEALHEIHDLLSGELTEDARQRILAHLEQCPPCAEPYDFYAELRKVVQQRCREQVPESLLLKVQTAITIETQIG